MSSHLFTSCLSSTIFLQLTESHRFYVFPIKFLLTILQDTTINMNRVHFKLALSKHTANTNGIFHTVIRMDFYLRGFWEVGRLNAPCA